MSTISALDFTGHFEQQLDTTHVVSMWHIPGGYDYSNANVIYCFFEKEETAVVFEKKWQYPPEMAVLLTIAQYGDIQQKTRQRCGEEGE